MARRCHDTNNPRPIVLPYATAHAQAQGHCVLIGDGGKLELSQLPEEMQMLLASELGAIRLIDCDTVHLVAAEFARDLSSAVRALADDDTIP